MIKNKVVYVTSDSLIRECDRIPVVKHRVCPILVYQKSEVK